MGDNSILFSIKNKGILRYNIEDDSFSTIIDPGKYSEFSYDLKHFLVLEDNYCTLKIYATNNSIKPKITRKFDSFLIRPAFLKKSLVMLLHRQVQMLNITTNTIIDEIDLPCCPNFTKKFIYSSSKNERSVYSIKKGKLVTLSTKTTAKNPDFYFNKNESYCIIACDNTAKIYETRTWEKRDTLRFKKDENRVSPLLVTFSPCGKCIVVMHLTSNRLKFYDIENKKTLLKHYWPSNVEIAQDIRFNSNKNLIFLENEKKLILYDYKNDKKTEHMTKKPITCFAITNELIAFSTGKKTKLIPINKN